MSDVTLTVEEVLQVLGGLDDVLSGKLRGPIVFKLGWIQRKLFDARRTFEESRNKVFEDFAEELQDKETGETKKEVPAHRMREFRQEVQDLLTAEITLDFAKIPHDELEKALEKAKHSPTAQSLVMIMPVLEGLQTE